LVRQSYKRPFDLAILVTSHVLLSPFLVLAWVLIPLAVYLNDRGPVFYSQERAGLGGRPFRTLKFRTMVPDADRIGNRWTSEHDPRVTGLGRVLRKTALDELPQLLSIWRGHMSWVGPRALDVSEQRMIETAIPGFERRLAVRPGLTGLAQVYNLDDAADSKLTYDLRYIEEMGPWLDVRIIIRSAVNTVLGRWDRRSGKNDPRSTP
jgi:lipopolysaccharide/colanic/teichoic acid biosynthesis glycosyltransferase